ncbi:MAG: 23S rRNA (uracil(1939)-C(5))-methyltransferase RlmD [Acidobacteria bacterium]|nr:MAG: 23S rRNA (uracil(1939)-C(5))-methyltransferase RlmD [Acidobacteriota bacterium]REK06347.1 MAG: 23S rRNA (uracil(1939)-C(5))-methyltransferase RlmD [Acidobacteriota bacterium]
MSSPLHEAVDCPHRVPCGACSLLRETYASQLERKREELRRTLSAEGRLDPRQLLPTVPSPRTVGYRNRAKMTLSSDRERNWSLGYFRRGTREVVDAPSCRVLVPELLETTRELRDLLNGRRRFPFALRHVDLRCGTDPRRQHLTLVLKAEEMPETALPVEAILDACPRVAGLAVNLNRSPGPQVLKGAIEPLAGEREVWVTSGDLELRVSPGSFFQVNLDMLPLIHQRMRDFFTEGRVLLDLYAGVGTHGLALRDRFRRVLCVEGVRSAVADARATIRRASVDNVEVVASPIHRAVRRLSGEKADAVVLNPSAAGADRATLDLILSSQARSLAYLSCDPTTLVRDLAVLRGGGWKLVSAQAIDMMPQTSQIEALALLRR